MRNAQKKNIQINNRCIYQQVISDLFDSFLGFPRAKAKEGRSSRRSALRSSSRQRGTS